ncbi:MAG: DUF3667 domain-containing protein [Bacteroidota bacterium]|nr:DUF3667 domain-containing protein [Bacteroidota bacterium]
MNNGEDRGKCATCGEKLYGKHCHVCGEKKVSRLDFTVKKFVEQAIDVVTHFDSKIWRSIYLLFRKPGFLVSEHLEGRRIKYAKPIQLFFVINVIYFLVLNKIGFDEITNPLSDHMNNIFYGKIATSIVNGKIAEKNITFSRYADDFYNETYAESKLLIILMIPVLALWFKLIFQRYNKLYYEHLIFSTYFFCFILLFYTFFINTFEYVFNPAFAEIIIIIVSAVYLYFSISHVYKFSQSKIILNAILSVIGLVIIVSLFRFLIFLTVYYTA